MVDMISLKWCSKPETVGELISTQLEDLSLCDVVFLCEDGRAGFCRWLLSPSPTSSPNSSLLTELLPPPDCSEKLLRADQAKVYLSLAGVQLRDLQLVLGQILGSKERLTKESLEVASMLGIPLRRRGVMGDMEGLVRDLLDEAVEMMPEEEENEDDSSLDDLEEEMEFSFTGGDDLVDEIICNSSLADIDGTPVSNEAQLVDLAGDVTSNEAPEKVPAIRSQSDVLQLPVRAQINPQHELQDSLMEEDPRPAVEIKVRRALFSI